MENSMKQGIGLERHIFSAEIALYYKAFKEMG